MVTGTVLVTGICMFWFVMIWNRFVRPQSLIRQARSDVDVQLRRRHNLISKLPAAAKDLTVLEQDTLKAVAEAHSCCLDLAESIPKPKADPNVPAMQQDIPELEDRKQMGRQCCNGAVRLYNVQRKSSASLIVSRTFYVPSASCLGESGEETVPERASGGEK